jgi:hypothetical protein
MAKYKFIKSYSDTPPNVLTSMAPTTFAKGDIIKGNRVPNTSKIEISKGIGKGLRINDEYLKKVYDLSYLQNREPIFYIAIIIGIVILLKITKII